MKRAETINPSMLAWARQLTGLSLEESATRIGLTTTKAQSAAEKLMAMERGELWPTRKQLENISTTYRRPITLFYLEKPPKIADRGEDFRTLAKPASTHQVFLLDALIRDIKVRQDLVKSTLEEEEENRKLNYIGSVSLDSDPSVAVDSVRTMLGMGQKSTQWRAMRGSRDRMFRKLRGKVEDLGIFVLLLGNLGSHHTKIDERIFRGFALSDPVAPFIVINEHDAISAKSFTLIHELVHILLGLTGISSIPRQNNRAHRSVTVERFCNDVASEFLLPKDELPKLGDFTGNEELVERISAVARNFAVSESMVAYKYCRLGKISNSKYRKLDEYYRERWQKIRKPRDVDTQLSAVANYYLVRRNRLGRPLVELVGRALRSEVLTYTRAARILGTRPMNVPRFFVGMAKITGKD